MDITPHCHPWHRKWEDLLNKGNLWEITGLRKINYQCLTMIDNINEKNNDNSNSKMNDIEQAFSWGFQVMSYNHPFFFSFFFFNVFCFCVNK